MNRAHTVEENGTAVVLLNCGRTLIFSVAPPKTGEVVYCSYHRNYETVKEGRAEYRARCQNCRYSRPFGAARLTAELKAAAHARNKSHTVELTQGAAVLHTFTRESGAPESTQLALDEDVPPF